MSRRTAAESAPHSEPTRRPHDLDLDPDLEDAIQLHPITLASIAAHARTPILEPLDDGRPCRLDDCQTLEAHTLGDHYRRTP